MTHTWGVPDLVAIAETARVEIVAAEHLRGFPDTQADAGSMLATAELGYYEAELRSLRSAALSPTPTKPRTSAEDGAPGREHWQARTGRNLR